MKALLRDLAATVLYASGVTRPADRRRLNIVTFHRVLPPEELAEYPLEQLVVTPEELAWFLSFFVEHFECGPLDRLFERWNRGEAFSRPPLAVTFDDALRDNYRHARPVLDRARVRASFFVPTAAAESGELLWHDRAAYAVRAALQSDEPRLRASTATLGLPREISPNALPAAVVERLKLETPARREQWLSAEEAALGSSRIPSWDGMMSFTEIAELFAEEHEIGSHSHTHPILTRVEDAALESELSMSKRVLEEHLGSAPTTFCYPNGDADERVVRAAERAGYRRAVLTSWGSNKNSTDPFRLLRFDMQSTTARSRHGTLSRARVAFRMSDFQPRPR